MIQSYGSFIWVIILILGAFLGYISLLRQIKKSPGIQYAFLMSVQVHLCCQMSYYLNFLGFFFNYLIADQNSLLMYPVIGLFSPHPVQRHYLLPICLNAYSHNSLKCCHFPALNSKSTSLLTQCTPFGCLYPFLQIPCLSNPFTNSKSITPIQVSPRNTRFHIPDGTPFKSTTDRSTSSH